MVSDTDSNSMYFFVVKNKKEILFSGPSVKDKKNVIMFKKKHKKAFTKGKRIYAKEKNNLKIKEFINKWKIKNKDRLKDMSIIKLEVKS